jgi:hypothetical protein
MLNDIAFINFIGKTRLFRVVRPDHIGDRYRAALNCEQSGAVCVVPLSTQGELKRAENELSPEQVCDIRSLNITTSSVTCIRSNVIALL